MGAPASGEDPAAATSPETATPPEPEATATGGPTAQARASSAGGRHHEHRTGTPPTTKILSGPGMPTAAAAREAESLDRSLAAARASGEVAEESLPPSPANSSARLRSSCSAAALSGPVSAESSRGRPSSEVSQATVPPTAFPGRASANAASAGSSFPMKPLTSAQASAGEAERPGGTGEYERITVSMQRSLARQSS